MANCNQHVNLNEKSVELTRPVSLQPSEVRGQGRATFGHTDECASICVGRERTRIEMGHRIGRYLFVALLCITTSSICSIPY